MKKVLIAIKNNSLIFTFNYQLIEDVKDLMNTNIISDNKLIFSDDYIIENSKIVGLFIKELIINKTISRVVITNLEILKILKSSFEVIDNVDTLFISDESNFTYEAYEILSNLKKFKTISCYSIPTYMIDLFDKSNIKIESRAEILYTSNFMELNNLISYSKIYYKSALKVSPPMNAQDTKDFEAFIKINRYLKTITFDACSLSAVEDMARILIENRIKGIRIIIQDNITSKEIIEELKKKKKMYKKEHIDLILSYTKEYVSKNFFKQLISSTLILCAFMVLVIASGSTIYVILNNKESEKNVQEISQRIEEKIAADNAEEEKKMEIPEVIEDNNYIPAVPLENQMIPKMRSLLDLNDETVGWLKVPGTNIDYPIVKTNNNDYYLDHNYDKKKDYNGWVYMNYLNNSKDLDKNTILFAHNRYYSGVMFGTLSNVAKENWYSEAKNISIYYNTMYEEMEWEVFSIYRIKVTDDYLQTSFSNDNEFLEFVSMLKERSIFQSDTPITSEDKILTLSTCVENDKRLVVHAVLRK
ncbi:MAG: class B sortase [Bacilli bacterium]|nr:class B sortase [Bacilli bacterium]